MRLRYWLRLLGQMLALALITSAAMTLISAFTRESVESPARMMAFYLLYMSALIQVVYLLTIYKVYLPVAVCFGCTRREALAGTQLTKFGWTAGVLLCEALLALAAGDGLFRQGLQLLPALLGGLLALGSLGGILGAVFQFFGRRGVVVTIGLYALFGALAGGAMALGFTGGIMLEASQLVNLCVGGAGLLFCLVDLLVERRLLASYAVRF